MFSEFVVEFTKKLLSGTQLFWITAAGDEKRIINCLEEVNDCITQVSKTTPRLQIETWSGSSGGTWSNNLQQLMVALTSLKTAGNGLYVFYDLDEIINIPDNRLIRRCIIDMCKQAALNGIDEQGTVYCKPIVIVSNEKVPHIKLRDFCDVLEFPLPDFKYFRNNLVTDLLANADIQPTSEQVDILSQSLLGLSEEKATNILAYCIAVTGKLDGLHEHILEEKRKALNLVEGLEYVPYSSITDKSDLGGYDNLLSYITECAAAMTANAKRLALDKPRGIALIGPPGTGKTTAAELIARELQTDLIKLDPSCFYSKYLGESQRNARLAFNTISSLKRCTVVVDEIEKIMGGSHQSQTLDAGVSSQILSMFLKWLADRDVSAASDEAIFVVATMNRLDGIPPEMLRAGRFDQIFFADLPDAKARADILRIHMRKRNIDPKHYGDGLNGLAAFLDNFSGAELEEVVVRARRRAFLLRGNEASSYEDVVPSLSELHSIGEDITPVASRDEAVANLRQQCEAMFTPISERIEQKSRRITRLNKK